MVGDLHKKLRKSFEQFWEEEDQKSSEQLLHQIPHTRFK